MKNKFILLVMCLSFLILIPSLSTSHSEVYNVSFHRDVVRLQTLQSKFEAATSPVDKYKYAAAIRDYLSLMEEKADDLKKTYYQPAMLIMTGEIPANSGQTKNQE